MHRIDFYSLYEDSGFKIRPSQKTRTWMDHTSDRFAYRCLPLVIANQHGWEIPNPVPFKAIWNGKNEKDAITITYLKPNRYHDYVDSHFGHGVLTFKLPYLVRTDEEMNLWVSGSPNHVKDGIQPLTGIVETNWLPFTFTMNWKFTAKNLEVRFDEGEPIVFMFPLNTKTIENTEPNVISIKENLELNNQLNRWAEIRQQVLDGKLKDSQWFLNYTRGTDVDGNKISVEHKTKLKLAKPSNRDQ